MITDKKAALRDSQIAGQVEAAGVGWASISTVPSFASSSDDPEPSLGIKRQDSVVTRVRYEEGTVLVDGHTPRAVQAGFAG